MFELKQPFLGRILRAEEERFTEGRIPSVKHKVVSIFTIYKFMQDRGYHAIGPATSLSNKQLAPQTVIHSPSSFFAL